MIVVLFALMYFLMIRPQRKQEQKRREQLSKVKVGDQVVTIGRLHGVVDEVNEAEKTVTLDCDGIYLVFDLSAVAQIKTPSVAPATKNDASSDSAESSNSAESDSSSTSQDSQNKADNSAASDTDKSEEK